ncbi:MAG: PolC-type DNA polymerase III [Bacillota bacterium]
MSVYIIEPDEAGALARLLPGLSPEETEAVAAARLRRVEVDVARRAWRVVLEGEKPIGEATLKKLEQRLLSQVTGVDELQFVFEAAPRGSGNGAGASGASEAAAAVESAATAWDPFFEVPPPEPPYAEEPDDDEYLERVLQRAAAGGILQAGYGGEGRPRRSAGNGNGKGNGNGSSLFKPQVDGMPTPLRELRSPRPDVVVEGEVMKWESREVRGGFLLSFDITDRTDSITVKAFVRGELPENSPVQEGRWVKVRGRAEIDRFTQELVITPTAVAETSPRVRTDDHPEKRVELHLHTKMSSLDGAADIQAVIEQAAAWGHPAVAITDHGVVHAFPEAYQAAKKAGIKLIYGMEGYLTDDADEKGRSYHIIILAANRKGLKHLYELVSLSHLHYFYRNPRIPRSELVKRREGLIIGSACEAGELFQAILRGEPKERLREIASFYDYLEIQPIDNNRFLIEDGTLPDEEALRNINRLIVQLGDELGLPVVATSDAHFLHPEDEIFRRIIMAGHGFSTSERPTPLYFRTTTEMLQEFAYLGEERARQVVIENTNAIAARCEEMAPLPKGLHAPNLPGAAEAIERIAKETARKRYGDPLPPIVEERLQRELRSIISNGFASLYYIAHKLVQKSREDGYLVGSRGSVGSSLVATMCGITEVNPLPPHYVCPQCHWSQFVTDGSVQCGIDLPRRDCPRCGTPLDKDGFDIPFETFMGFHGDKVPDIDLNFSGEYQSRAHQYAEQLLGSENVYRAGTIATLAERTAYGYVKKYLESVGVEARAAEVDRLVRGCTGVRRTTGQHPGGLVVVPEGEDIHDFTPVQYPANDRSAGVITTHFDYSALEDNLVKLDILGHDDPTILRMLQDLTGVDVTRIPLDDPATMAIFSGLESLGLTPADVGGDVGTLGIPEFGTPFVRQMLEDTRPRTFGELVRISGLSHGTNVWLNNAQDLIREGKATLREVIATRDDIMLFLIQKGMDAGNAFRIMEQVRKGKGLKPEDVELMRQFDLPPWYIDSCQKISYMFPKAHAAAYVMMAFRIAYFKVHYPEAFYAASFTVRAEECDAELLVQGKDAIRRAIEAVERKGPDATARDKAVASTMQLVLEALARGIKFRRVHLYESDATRFRVTPEGLLPPFISLNGVGVAAAESIVQAREQGRFTSVDDLRTRARLTKSVIDTLRRHGTLEGLPETDQLTLF